MQYQTINCLTHADLGSGAYSQATYGHGFGSSPIRGMTLMDTTDSVLMLGAYGWAFVKPIRKLYYSMTITAVSVVVAVVVGGLEALNLIGDKLGLTDRGGFWGALGSLNDSFGVLGLAIVGIFVVAWLISYVIYRVNRYDEIEVSTM